MYPNKICSSDMYAKADKLMRERKESSMSNLTREEEERYSDLAMKHAHFLCDQVFIPTFNIAFIHGAKHMKEDMMSGVGAAKGQALKPLSPVEESKAELGPNPNWNAPDIIEKQQQARERSG